MKKNNLLLIVCVFIISIFIVSCNKVNNVKNNEDNNEMTISKDYLSKNNSSGMGSNFKIKNIKKGKYNISLYSKEFAKGKLIKEQNLYNKTLDFQKSSEFNISIHQEDENIKILTGESESNEATTEATLDFFNKDFGVLALFEIDGDKKIEIDKDLPIIGYAIDDETRTIDNTDIDEIFNQNTVGEIVIYMKITSVK